MRIGIDLGGTKIEGVALTPDGGVAATLRRPTPQHDYPGTVAAIVAVADALRREVGGVPTIGIGTPGSAARTAAGPPVWQGANSVWLNGRPLAHDLERALGQPIRVANDADCFAVSEAVDGAAAGAGTVFGVILGTGVGGGLVVGGRPLAGPNGIAGEWGHVPLPWLAASEYPGPACYCGRRGCIETFLSGRAFERDHRERTGETRRATDIAEAALAGDAAAAASLDTYVDRLGRALAMLIDIVDPDIIVLGGGVSRIGALYERLPAAIAPHVFSAGFATPVVRNRHGDSSGVRGAAQLWPLS